MGQRLAARQRLVAGPEAAGIAQIELGGGGGPGDLQAQPQALHQLALLGAFASRRPGAHQVGQRRHAAIDRQRQVPPEARPRTGQIPQLASPDDWNKGGGRTVVIDVLEPLQMADCGGSAEGLRDATRARMLAVLAEPDLGK